MDLDDADSTFETAGMLVRMLLSCGGVVHPATGAGEFFDRPDADGHAVNVRLRGY